MLSHLVIGGALLLSLNLEAQQFQPQMVHCDASESTQGAVRFEMNVLAHQVRVWFASTSEWQTLYDANHFCGYSPPTDVRVRCEFATMNGRSQFQQDLSCDADGVIAPTYPLTKGTVQLNRPTMSGVFECRTLGKSGYRFVLRDCQF